MTYRHITSSILFVSAIATAGCIEFKDKDSAKKDTASTANVASAADSADVSFPSYDAYSLDTAGTGARWASTPADDSAYGKISERSATAPTRGGCPCCQQDQAQHQPEGGGRANVERFSSHSSLLSSAVISAGFRVRLQNQGTSVREQSSNHALHLACFMSSADSLLM